MTEIVDLPTGETDPTTTAAVADAIHQLMWRSFGLVATDAHPEVLMGALRDAGYEVRPVRVDEGTS